jgi:hypothetical protein
MVVNGWRLWSDGAVRVNPAASKEPVPQHVLGKEKKDDHQDDYKQEPSNPERGWLVFFRGRRIRTSCHQICLSAGPAPCHCTAIQRIMHFPRCRSNSIVPLMRSSPAAFTHYDQAVARSELDVT